MPVLFPLRLLLVAWLGVALAVVGCQRADQESAEISQWRSRLLVASEPADAVTLSQLAVQLGMEVAGDSGGSGGDGDSPPANAQTADPQAVDPQAAQSAGSEIVVIGRVYSGDLDPFETGRASFLLTELPEQGHGDDHDPDNCPFCKRRAARLPSAIVQILDESGQPLAIDARQLLGLKAKDVIVVRGTATPAEMNTIMIVAEQLSIRGS